MAERDEDRARRIGLGLFRHVAELLPDETAFVLGELAAVRADERAKLSHDWPTDNDRGWAISLLQRDDVDDLLDAFFMIRRAARAEGVREGLRAVSDYLRWLQTTDASICATDYDVIAAALERLAQENG